MRIVKEFILREIAGEYVLVPTGTTSQEFNGLITMSDVAVTIWKNLETIDNLDAMVEIILNEYDVDEETARNDVTGFITELLAGGFIECTKEDKTW